MSHSLGHQPRKRFGQNFLCDERIIDAIIQQINPNQADNIVEIGPGLGAITKPLLAATNGKLTVIELDRDLAHKLRLNFASQSRLEVEQADALKFNFTSFALKKFAQETPPDQTTNDQVYSANNIHKCGLRVVGNLPYNISTPLLFHLIRHINVIRDMHFMLQKELVERITANPNSKAWGRLSVMMQYHCQAFNILPVPPSAFRPAPKVHSAVVKLIPRNKEQKTAINESHFTELVRLAFSLRRKTLKNCLSPMARDEDFQASEINPGARAETLELKDFIRLSNTIVTNTKP